MTGASSGIDLYWLPLGAGGHFVRLNGRVYEAVVAGLERRSACDIYHSALEVCVAEGRFVIESALSATATALTVASLAKVPSAAAGRDGCGSSATSFAAGETASSPTSPRQSRARAI